MTVKFNQLNQSLQQQIICQLGDSASSPNWNDTDSMEVGFGLGANSYNLCLWQNDAYWHLSIG